jgi:hypothetical protein
VKKACAVFGVAAAVPVAAAIVAPQAVHAAAAAVRQAPATRQTHQRAAGKKVASHWDRLRDAGIPYGPGHYSITRAPARLWSPGNGILFSLWSDSWVNVTCYYSGTTAHASDPYWDHFTSFSGAEAPFTQTPGHVSDYHVNMGGRYPYQNGIPKCG